MIRTRAWPVRAMYILVAFALVISLMISAAPSKPVAAAGHSVDAWWDRVTTPSEHDWKLAPGSEIYDWAIGDDGKVAYAVVHMNRTPAEAWTPWYLLRSKDHAATWSDITSGIKTEIDKKGLGSLQSIELVKCDAEDPNFVAVVLWVTNVTAPHVFTSSDGGAKFSSAGALTVGAITLCNPSDIAVSPLVAGKRNIAVVGDCNVPGPQVGLVFRSEVMGDSAGSWENATTYLGWDGIDIAPVTPTSIAVTDVKFAPSWSRDSTVLVTTVTGTGTSNYTVHLQTGTWGLTEGWNKKSTAGIGPVVIKNNLALPIWLASAYDWRLIAGITLPSDYAARDAGTRYAWVWVNYYHDPTTPRGEIFVVDNDFAREVAEQIRLRPWLTNVAYMGTIASGKAIAGVLGKGTYDPRKGKWDLLTDTCQGVEVYRYDTVGPYMDICCPAWRPTCKLPTGTTAMAAFWATSDPASTKAYSVALRSFLPKSDGGDEGAWSWSYDDGETWNQLSLIDTRIDFLSDVAVSPNCNKTMLVSINLEFGSECDSVWLHAENLPEDPDYSGTWIRTWSQRLEKNHGLLRLAPDEDTGETVYLVDRETDNIYWNELETLACWRRGSTTGLTEIVDLAVKDKATIYALDTNGMMAMSDDYALGWHTPVKSELDTGWTIAVHGDDVLVGSREGEVSHSTDGGETFVELEDLPTSGYVTVAFDSYFDTNNMIYAAVGDYPNFQTHGGIYRWIVDESTAWTDLEANPTIRQLTGDLTLDCPLSTHHVFYTGLVVDNADGNPMTSPSTGGVLYASYVARVDTVVGNTTQETWYTGVARQLTPAWDFCCDDTEWDYLVKGKYAEFYSSYFTMTPKALKICGCLTPDTYTKLFAIGHYPGPTVHPLPLQPTVPATYDMKKAEFGTVWMFEDCYSKWGPTPSSPADGAIVPALLCAGCHNMPFGMSWDRMCDACNYQVQFALDSDFNHIWIPSADLPTKHSCITGGWEVRPIPASNPSVQTGSWFIPGETYYWRVRSVLAETDQVIRSWWSPVRSFTVAPKAGTGVSLISPAAGASDVPRANIAFTWTSLADVDSFSFVLSPNADLSGSVGTYDGPNTGYTFTNSLSPNTSYYWRVTGIKNGAATSEAVGTFRTSAAEVFCSPQSGLCFNTEAALREHHEQLHKDAMRTPAWVWVIIALGAVLVIVVIVLIFRTRRV